MTSSQIEFTGERVIPGQVDTDLWNEHFSRYLFAARLARHKRVLDLACGTGYGTAELARAAHLTVGLDIAAQAVDHAAREYGGLAMFLRASASAAPFASGSFDLITAFEVIEHLEDWESLLDEARRLLAPGGQFMVSTPNRSYYAESRRAAGPNPFHTHEFEFDEFREALTRVFPHVSMFVQNHASAVVFQPAALSSAGEIRMEKSAADPAASHFFVAVCALSPQTGGPAFVYLPSAANVLREREEHIRRLEGELAQKNEWLEKSQREHAELVALHRALKAEIEAKNKWGAKLDAELSASAGRVVALQEELAREQSAAREMAAAYEEQVAALSKDCAERTEWARETETRLTAEVDARSRELAECVALLDRAEKTVEERSLWAQGLDREKQALEAELAILRGSRWVRIGRRFGLGN